MPIPAAHLALVPLIAAGSLALTGACTHPGQRIAGHDAFAQSERRFAERVEAVGIRAAFREAFAEDGVWMTPAPSGLDAAFATRPSAPDPRAVRLEWEPAWALVAASGELGVTGGPSRLSMRDGSRVPRHGIYVSVWKRDAAGDLRVALDGGVFVPEPSQAWPAPPTPSAVLQGDPASIEALLAREREAALDAGVWLAWLASDAHLYRDDVPPAAGAAAVASALASVGDVGLVPAGGAMASSADLAYSYGAWRSPHIEGHYVHIWTRDACGRWLLSVVLRLRAA